MALSGVSRTMWALALLLNVAGLAIAIAGVAKLTDMCRKDDNYWKTYHGLLGQFLQNPDKNLKYDCGIFFSLDWWIVMGHGALLIYSLLATFVDAIRSKLTMLHCFSVSTTLFCIYAYRFITAGYIVMGNSDVFMRGCAAASAGAVVVLTMNFVFAFLTAFDD